ARGQRDLITLVGHAAMRADAVAVQEQHDLADDLLLGPAHDNPLGPLGADAGHLSQTMRVLLDDIKTVSPHARASFFCIDRAVRKPTRSFSAPKWRLGVIRFTKEARRKRESVRAIRP